MSFHITFAARSVHEARFKLNYEHAPAAVKALIELALAAVPTPKLTPPQQAIGMAASGGDGEAREGLPVSGPTRQTAAPSHFGVFVEVWGHIADAGDGGRSEIQRFVVQPLAT
jgi:hypothetical protein